MKQNLTLFTIIILLFGLAACGSLSGDDEACPLDDTPYPLPEPDYNAKRVRDLSPFEAALSAYSADRAAELDDQLTGKTVLDIQTLLESGDLTSEKLVTYYVDRIQRYDIDGLNSVMELNPEALAIARSLDEERDAGSVRGDMHGIPVLLKDNIAADGMHAAAGAAALAGWQPDRDAYLVQQLRDNGAIILGKANLSEWANWMDGCMPNGFSALGGQTRNPYGPYDTLGSSSGSAVAAAANLAAVTVASETQGSLILPAGINSVVGIKTSRDLVNGDYIIPLLPFQDVAGPMGRTVTDVAVLLSAMTAVDARDFAPLELVNLAGTDFTQFLTPQAAEELHVGIAFIPEANIAAIRDSKVMDDDLKKTILDKWNNQNELSRQAADALKASGIEVVELSSDEVLMQPDVEEALTHGYKLAINEFLGQLGDQVSVSSLDEIVAFNNEDLANRAPYGQDHLEESLASKLSDDEFETIRDENISAAQDGLNALFEKHDIDIVAGSATQAYAAAGFPAISVPAGYDADGQPQALIMIAGYLGEPALISAAYAFEQAAQARVEPDLEATMALIKALDE